MSHSFFIHSSVGERLGCVHVLAVVNSAAVNTGEHVSFSVVVFSGYMVEKEMVTHCSILARQFPWTQEPEPGGLQFMVSQRVGHDRATDTHTG